VSEINRPLEDARTLLAALPRRADGVLLTSDAAVPACVQLVNLFRTSGMGQRQWCSAVGIGSTTLGMWLTGRRGRGAPWPALTAALGIPTYAKPAPKMTRHAVVCREWRLRQKVRRAGPQHLEEVTHVAA